MMLFSLRVKSFMSIQRQDSLTNENAMTLGASGLRRSLCSEVNPVSERNYSSYSSQDESRPRSRSSSGRRSSEPRRSKKRGKRSPGRTALWVIGTILLVAVTTGAIMCCFAAVYIRNNILPLNEIILPIRPRTNPGPAAAAVPAAAPQSPAGAKSAGSGARGARLCG